MKITTKIILPIILLGSIGIAVYSYTQHQAVSVTSVVTETQPEKKLISNNILSVDVTYPVISGKGKEVEAANVQLHTLIDSRVESFKKDAQDSAKTPIDLPKDIKSTVLGSPSIEEKNGRYVAIFMGMEWYMRGAAHPFHTIDTYIYDYKLGALVSVPDLFKQGSPYLQTLSQLSRVDLKAQSKQGDVGYVYQPVADNFSKILPRKDGLTIYFEEYQVASYAAGPQQVVIPYAKLKDIINLNGVLGMYIQ
jgi:hypothetical protein